MKTTNEQKWKYLSELEIRYKTKRKGDKCDTPRGFAKLVETLSAEASGLPVEKMWAVYINNSLEMVGYVEVSMGTLSETLVHPRNIFSGALLTNAAQVVLAHNHPSGNATPSSEDIETTKRMVEAGKLLGINLLDHIIITDTGHTSLREEGYIS